MRSCGIQLKVISLEQLKISILDVSLKITILRLQLHLPGANESPVSGLLTILFISQDSCMIHFYASAFRCRRHYSFRLSVRSYVHPSKDWNTLFAFVHGSVGLSNQLWPFFSGIFWVPMRSLPQCTSFVMIEYIVYILYWYAPLSSGRIKTLIT